ncbi:MULTISPECIES: carboxy terminal-processing peptidase [Oceanimonas]|uniref:Tail-specific peptidase n=1 Tax=Oceanimonas doudoroffii TaxID=84158 RepID=A0A233RGH9_9GAMM|nr:MULTISPECIES: carboxy terminal-processing peptidase [Oceanimonas]NHI02038.1 Tail-specific protease [Oceanimonas sp. MB9]OXY82489.1 tail-specific peptidase [Oceanimonas doudoroffii]
MISHGIRLSLVAAGMLVAGVAWAVPPAIEADAIPVLAPESQHAAASKRITALFTRSHYKQFMLDDAFSQAIFDRYIESLDYGRNIFTQQDIRRFERYRDRFDDLLRAGRLDAAFDMFNDSLRHRYERLSYALSLLDTPMTFDGDEDYQFDRTEADWPADQRELDELWRKRVKFDALSLALADKDWSEIKDTLTKRYNNAIKRLAQSESEDAFQSFANAFARAIEPHTSYLSPRNAERFETEMNLSLEGIGAVLQAEDDYTVIRSLVPGGPAAKSSELQPDDRIIGVGQAVDKITDVIGWRLDEVVDLIKGPKGTKVWLQIQRGQAVANTPRIVELTRDTVRLEDRAASGKVLEVNDRRIGVIEIPSFYVNLSVDVAREIDKLKQQKVQGLVIDLRANGGGALTEASALTGLFIDSGPVVQIRDGLGRISVNGDDDDRTSYDGPMAVLVDRYSASASEIFAAAMKDYGRAVILGENTFGKGTVQQHRSLSRIYDLYENPMGFVQFTIAKFYRINGGSTQNRGVSPDIPFPTAVAAEETGESLEKNALPWDQIESLDFAHVQDLSPFLGQLRQRHQARIEQDPEFAYVFEDIREYLKLKDKDSVSLNLAERKAELTEQDAKSLARLNDRLRRANLDPVQTLDEAPKDFEPEDSYLLEAARITADLADMLG